MNIKQLKLVLIGVSITSSLSVMANVDLGNGPDGSLLALTNCSSVSLTNVMTGYLGRYSYKAGFNVEEGTGFTKRKKSKTSNKCILPSLKSRQIAYFEVNTDSFRAAGEPNDWKMQCVRSDKPDEGSLTKKESPTEASHKVNYLSGKHMMLPCGHSQKKIKECEKGSSSVRSAKWNTKLANSGKTMFSVIAQRSSLAPAGGEKLYCQYYNKTSQKSLFAFEYVRKKK